MDTGWTVATLERHLTGVIAEYRKQTEQRFADSEKAVAAALAAADKLVMAALDSSEKAVSKAERSAEMRHADLVNRLDTTAFALTEKIEALAIRFERTEGKSGGREQLWGALIGFAGVATAVIAVIVGLAR